MKLVIAWLSLVGLAAIVASSCSVNHRSGEFTCVTSGDCVGEAAGRICSGGFCVIPGGGIDAAMSGHDGNPIHIDASVHPDAAACPEQCTSCDLGQMTCKILCNNSGNCATTVTCPLGFHCDITCGPSGSCKTVDCSESASCNVACTGQNSCRQVSCGVTACDVTCSGQGSCRGVACGTSCACDVTCGEQADCSAVFCSHQVCDDFTTGGCSSQFDPVCNTCP